MTRARVVPVVTALIALVMASAAPAAGGGRTTKLSGHVPGDKQSVVRLTVVRSGGETQLVKRFRFKKVLANCNGADQRITLDLTGRIPVKDRNYRRAYGDDTSGIVKVSGRVGRNGRRTVGLVRSRAVSVVGIGVCKLPPTSFTASN